MYRFNYVYLYRIYFFCKFFWSINTNTSLNIIIYFQAKTGPSYAIIYFLLIFITQSIAQRKYRSWSKITHHLPPRIPLKLKKYIHVSKPYGRRLICLFIRLSRSYPPTSPPILFTNFHAPHSFLLWASCPSLSHPSLSFFFR